MIELVEIRDFALVREVSLRLAPGLNVFTGETGAGKSLVVDALAFCLGARRGVEVIASGAERAEVRLTLEGGSVIERSIGGNGRAVLRIDDAVASVEAVRRLTAGRVEIHGQAEQLALLRPAVQLALLDRFGGCAGLAAEVASLVRQLRDTRRSLAGLRSDERERERRIDQLRFEVSEIREARLQPDELEALRAERTRLASTARRRAAAESALASLSTFDAGGVVKALESLSSDDPGVGGLVESAALLDDTAAELSRALRRYAEAIEEDPRRLEVVEERLDLIARLRRKYGDSPAEILAYGVAAEEELAALENYGTRQGELVDRESGLLEALAEASQRLSEQRREAACEFVAAASHELESLGMKGSSLAVGFACIDDENGVPVALPDYEMVSGARRRSPEPGEPVRRSFSEGGVDQVEFLASFNPGEVPRPLSSVASGGETSRFLLALTAVLGHQAERKTIVLDEADEGVGGRSGALIGKALLRLAGRHQVLCVTHLPQVAAMGDRHFAISKTQERGGRVASSCREVSGAERVAELAAMLGGPSKSNLAAARELLAAERPQGRREPTSAGGS